jgi:predicted MPP superfamily phosphohydrolase
MQKDMIVPGIILLLVIWAFLEQKLLITARYTITSAKLPHTFHKTSFVVLADLHNRTFGRNNKRLIRRIEKLSPDFLIVAGDMINKKAYCYPSSAFTLLECLSKKYKIYYAYGNHEQNIELIHKLNLENNSSDYEDVYSTWVEYKEKLIKLNVIFLNNESTYLIKNDRKLRITGLSIGPKYFERNTIPVMEQVYLNSLIGDSSEVDYQILIAHNPIYFLNYANWGADLTISGHQHGGMVRLPGIGGILSPQAKFFPKYHSGNHTEKGQEMLVSRGLGSHSIMPRLFNIPEILYISLKNK